MKMNPVKKAAAMFNKVKKTKMALGGYPSVKGDKGFAQAFKEARAEKGIGSTFMYNGRNYSTARADDGITLPEIKVKSNNDEGSSKASIKFANSDTGESKASIVYKQSLVDKAREDKKKVEVKKSLTGMRGL